jgi:hypothetical protein
MTLSNSASDMDKLISIKGLVIRTTPIIPDMKSGMLHDVLDVLHALCSLPLQPFSNVRYATTPAKST